MTTPQPEGAATSQIVWNTYLRVANAISEYVNLAEWSLQLVVNRENGGVDALFRPAEHAIGQVRTLRFTPDEAADYQVSRSLARAFAEGLR